MNKGNLIFNTIIDHFLETNQLGDFDEAQMSLTLYCIPNNSMEINQITRYMNSVTVKYKIVVLNLDEEITNIKILDIGV